VIYLKFESLNFIKKFESLKNSFEKIKNNLFLHILIFLLLFLILLLIFWTLSKNIDLSKFYSNITANILNSKGIKTEIIFNDTHYGIFVNNMTINILETCTGLFELCVFLALIFATLTVSFKYKIFGAFFLIILFFVFNEIRILIMVYLFETTNIFVVDVLHTILFKVGFFLFYIFFYYIWLNISQSERYAKI